MRSPQSREATVERGTESFRLACPAHALGREMHANRHMCTRRAHRSRFARASPPAELLLSDSASRRSLVISTRRARKPTSPGFALWAVLAGPAAMAPRPALPRRTARLAGPPRPHTGPAGPSSATSSAARRRHSQHFLRPVPAAGCQRQGVCTGRGAAGPRAAGGAAVQLGLPSAPGSSMRHRQAHPSKLWPLAVSGVVKLADEHGSRAAGVQRRRRLLHADFALQLAWAASAVP